MRVSIYHHSNRGAIVVYVRWLMEHSSSVEIGLFASRPDKQPVVLNREDCDRHCSLNCSLPWIVASSMSAYRRASMWGQRGHGPKVGLGWVGLGWAGLGWA